MEKKYSFLDRFCIGLIGFSAILAGGLVLGILFAFAIILGNQ